MRRRAVGGVVAAPVVAQQTLIGRSVEHRRIAVTRIAYADDQVRRRVLVVGCVHGDECAGRRIVRTRLANRNTGSAIACSRSKVQPIGWK